MGRWGLAYLGRSTFPKDVSELELQRAFTFTDRERRDIREAFRVRYRLAAAVQLGFLRLTGRALASVAYVPAVVLHHLRRQQIPLEQSAPAQGPKSPLPSGC